MPSFSDDQQVTTLLGSIDDTITAEVVAGAVKVSPYGESIVVEPSPRVQIDAVEGLLSTDVETYTDGVSGSASVVGQLYAVTTGIINGGYGTIRTRRQCKYRPGQGLSLPITAKFTTPVANSLQLAGGIRGINVQSKKQVLVSLLIATTLACEPPPCGGSDVSGWKPVEVSPDAKTAPIVECGKTVGFDITVPAGDHASTMWRYESAAPVKAGEKVAFAVALESFGPPLFSLRPSIESASRSELGFVEHKAVGTVRAVVPDQTVPTPGAFRVLQVVFPVSGAGHWRLTNFTGW